MKKFIVALLSVTAAAAFAADVPVQGFLDSSAWRRASKKSYSIVKENGKPVSVKINAPGVVQVMPKVFPLDGAKDIFKTYEGISFEVKGDGSKEWGAITVLETGAVAGRYYFPVKSTEWKEYRVAFADMAPAGDHTLGLPARFAVGRIYQINLSDRWRINWTNIKRNPFSYEVRNLKFIEKIAPVYSYGKYKARPLAEVVKEMKAGKEVLVTCFGDSITAGTALKKTDKRYSILLGETLVKKFNNSKIKTECVAIGGAHTYDSIAWLERDLTKGVPAVATMLIGYNNRSGAQNAETYRKQLEMWIERLLCKSKGNTAIILIPSIQGVPRWEAQKEMAAVTYEVAKKYNCTICPIEQVIEKLGALEYKAKYLADAIHPNQAGHIIFAKELAKCFDK